MLGWKLVYLLENFGKLHSKISRFLFLSHLPVKNTKILVYKTVNLYFPFDKLYNIYVIFKCKNYLFVYLTMIVGKGSEKQIIG